MGRISINHARGGVPREWGGHFCWCRLLYLENKLMKRKGRDAYRGGGDGGNGKKGGGDWASMDGLRLVESNSEVGEVEL